MQESPQENNNFETIISTWRRLSGEQAETSVFASMSGDSGHPFKKKEEESNLLSLEKPKGPIATAASAAIIAQDEKPPDQDTAVKAPENPDEKQEKSELLKFDKDSKEAAGDASFEEKDNKSFLEHDSISNAFSDTKNVKDRGDKVDSVYLRPPPPQKVRSNASTADDEDCGIKCLYYTLQCCDCVLM